MVLLVSMLPIAIAEYLILNANGERFSVDALLANIALIHALGLFETETWNFVSWSISVELYTRIAAYLSKVSFAFSVSSMFDVF